MKTIVQIVILSIIQSSFALDSKSVQNETFKNLEYQSIHSFGPFKNKTRVGFLHVFLGL